VILLITRLVEGEDTNALSRLIERAESLAEAIEMLVLIGWRREITSDAPSF
jgi:hypothetical protein